MTNRSTYDNTTIADRLNTEVRVLCWVMTSPNNHASKAVHVLATWGRRCDKIIFSSESNENANGLPLLVINTSYGRHHLTAKTMQTFDHIYRHHLNEFDWFLKADDDTYVIVENLRYFLSSQDPAKPIYFGHHFSPYVKQGYNCGGAGYAISREALRRFGERPKSLCKDDYGFEDVEMGRCMELLGVVLGNTRDKHGRTRFHNFNLDVHIQGYYPNWYYHYDKYAEKETEVAVSDYSITFHYVPIEQMYMIEFLLYFIRPYGVVANFQDVNLQSESGKSAISKNLP
ncbi:hypothetical protein HELRODRAFT_189993 [Helobdella robusta]|uniref:Glycoprotein-N-acetylgalactosamine 3-beta-galactosyltransferase 1 n=1 Tax=Helobdella robusta TaxID=6412 RepID=T1FRK5_HELRO|nr:hypothetical protein HELRODRAFT_189993 [Helobdella robusta]ESO11536.1 hypothetical protein HELRODRAFT_189993 [Helobdella robusta]